MQSWEEPLGTLALPAPPQIPGHQALSMATGHSTCPVLLSPFQWGALQKAWGIIASLFLGAQTFQRGTRCE